MTDQDAIEDAIEGQQSLDDLRSTIEVLEDRALYHARQLEKCGDESARNASIARKYKAQYELTVRIQKNLANSWENEAIKSHYRDATPAGRGLNAMLNRHARELRASLPLDANKDTP